ncbi:carbohydrate ABC transporter permease [Catellatospora coxensis]|uniref:Sugar ABC transporter permease n=1 Tax=Catellatospora coxensis TaxID=310354 RepID=A0A8J3P7Z4_9ACTN|nr:sugar ABC transporter permease [Catellatospora coxensis]GIG07157.1 sugar ABC transporter permease [Catellatospora coxensis]
MPVAEQPVARLWTKPLPLPHRRPRRSLLHRESVAGYLLLTPWLTGLAAIIVAPVLYSLALSFTDYNVITGELDWIGLANYERMFTADPRYWRSVQVTVVFVAVSVPLKLVVAFAVAALLNGRRRGAGTLRALVYLPSLLGVSVALAITWRTMFGSGGAVNQVLGMFGVPDRSWATEPDTALFTLILLAAWQFGGPMVIYLAAMRQVPADYAESARIDGASRWRILRSVTLPTLSPVILLTVVMETIAAFQGFTAAFVFGDGGGGPEDATLTYTLYLYLRGFAGLEMGYASAMAWVFLVAVGALTGLIFWTSRWWVHYPGGRP